MIFRCLFVAALLAGALSGFSQASDIQRYNDLVLRAEAEYREGYFAAAEPLFLEALELIRHKDEEQAAALLTYLGSIYSDRDELAKAERAFLESLAIYKRHANTHGTVLQLRNLGAIYAVQRRDKDALRLLREALALTKDSTSTDRALTSLVLNSMGILYYYKGKLGRAETLFDQALTLSTQDVTLEPYDTLDNLGAIYTRQGKYEKADQVLRRALEIKQSKVGSSHPSLSLTLDLLGRLYMQSGQYARAETMYQQAVQALKPYGPQLETRVARLLYALKKTYDVQGNAVASYRALADAAPIALRNLTKPTMVDIASEYATQLKKRGDIEKGKEIQLALSRAHLTVSVVVGAKGLY